MTENKNDFYLEMVSSWEKKKANGLSPSQKALFLEKAQQKIVERALQTLSEVTLMVVLDRVLYQSKAKFPILSEIKLENNNLNFKDLLKSESGHDSEDLPQALNYLLVELLRVLGRITADILTEPLRQELLKMTWKNEDKKIRSKNEYPTA